MITEESSAEEPTGDQTTGSEPAGGESTSEGVTGQATENTMIPQDQLELDETRLKYLEGSPALLKAILLLRRVSSATALWCDEYKFKPNGVNLTFARIAIVMGDQGMNFGALVSASQISSSTLSRALTRMESAGLVLRETNPKERRQVNIYLTDEGKTYRAKSLRLISETAQALLGHIPEGDLEQISDFAHELLTQIEVNYRGFG